MDSSYVSRMVNLTILAPDIVTAILDEALPPELTLFQLAVDPPALWEEQREQIGVSLEHETQIVQQTKKIYAHLAPNEVSEEAVEVLTGLKPGPLDCH